MSKYSFKTKGESSKFSFKTAGVFHAKSKTTFITNKSFKLGGISSLKLADNAFISKNPSDVESKSMSDGYTFSREIFHAEKGTKKYLGKNYLKAEEQILKKFGKKEVTNKTAFSPFKSRRNEFNLKYKKSAKVFKKNIRRSVSSALYQKSGIKKGVMVFRRSKLANKIATSNHFRNAKVIVRSINSLVKALKGVGVLGSAAIKAIISLVGAVGAVLVVFVIIALLLTSIINNRDATADSELISVTATGTIKENILILKAVDENDRVLFKINEKGSGSRWSYKDDNTNITVKIDRKNQIYLKGTYKKQLIAMKGEYKSSNITLTGYIGDMAEFALNGAWVSPFGSKKYVVTSPFGPRRLFGGFHYGWDLAVPGEPNAPVFAVAEGTVIATGHETLGGNFVKIDYGNGVNTIYYHLSKITCSKGDKVKPLKQVGVCGNTGKWTTGPHLHFEVRVNGKAVDGSKYLPEIKKVYSGN